MLNGIRANFLDSTIEIINADQKMKEDFALAQQFVLSAIGRHNEKTVRTGKARTVSSATSGRKKGDDGPWMNKGKPDHTGIRSGKYDHLLSDFKVKEGGYSDKEWKNLHPMKKRKIFLNKDKATTRSVKAVEIQDMGVLKDAHLHNQNKIASLKRKLVRETKRRYDAEGRDYENEEDIFASDAEVASHITEEASAKSGTSVRNGLKRNTKKKARFRDTDNDS